MCTRHGVLTAPTVRLVWRIPRGASRPRRSSRSSHPWRRHPWWPCACGRYPIGGWHALVLRDSGRRHSGHRHPRGTDYRRRCSSCGFCLSPRAADLSATDHCPVRLRDGNCTFLVRRVVDKACTHATSDLPQSSAPGERLADDTSRHTLMIRTVALAVENTHFRWLCVRVVMQKMLL
eukprot:SAG31_NODE_4934_length_2850_cov_5.152253_3_plen_177_part_00